MDIDADLRRKTIVSAAAVGLFLVSLIGIGTVFGGGEGFSSTGGLAIIGALVGFVLLMAAVGAWLARVSNDDAAEAVDSEPTE
ncbi:hypothetical protein EGH24_03105 [Halonotius terrestris]|uniref:Uncharacterized protein n=1 Tax=Halonotius terrestris TaxID=2487750 RepID=A0A8J8TE38_9EURY|nr:hypothetical protein [Halonotius terrestris]TQQ83784.1 hypothetical protein EGH24_03105 [Halonotius terrestris]